MQLVQDKLQSHFNGKIDKSVNPDLVVAQGAALYAKSITKARDMNQSTDIAIRERVTVSLGIKITENRYLTIE